MHGYPVVIVGALTHLPQLLYVQLDTFYVHPKCLAPMLRQMTRLHTLDLERMSAADWARSPKHCLEPGVWLMYDWCACIRLLQANHQRSKESAVASNVQIARRKTFSIQLHAENLYEIR